MAEQPSQEKQKTSSKKPAMVMRARITEVEARKRMDAHIDGVELRMEIDDVIATNKFLEVWFTYLAIYQPEIGLVRMRGLIMIDMGEKAVKQHADGWAANKMLDEKLAQQLLSNINYRCGSEAIMACKLVDLPSPIVPPPVGVTMDESAPRPGARPAQGPNIVSAPRPANVPAPQFPPRPAAAPPAPPRPTMPPPAMPTPTLPGQSPTSASKRQFDYVSPFTGKKPS